MTAEHVTAGFRTAGPTPEAGGRGEAAPTSGTHEYVIEVNGGPHCAVCGLPPGNHRHAVTRIVGLDLSLVSTGVATITTQGATTMRVRSKLRGHDRLDQLLTDIGQATRYATLVVVEGPSYESRSTGQQGHHERAGLWWLVTHGLHKRHVPVAVVSPSSLKKYATGKGNASKDDVLAAVIRRYVEVDVEGNDEADALILAALGWHHVTGTPLVPLPALNAEALGKCQWPADVAA